MVRVDGTGRKFQPQEDDICVQCRLSFNCGANCRLSDERNAFFLRRQRCQAKEVLKWSEWKEVDSQIKINLGHQALGRGAGQVQKLLRHHRICSLHASYTVCVLSGLKYIIWRIWEHPLHRANSLDIIIILVSFFLSYQYATRLGYDEKIGGWRTTWSSLLNTILDPQHVNKSRVYWI